MNTQAATSELTEGDPVAWATSQDEYLTKHYGLLSTTKIAEVLGRSRSAVWQRARKLGRSRRAVRWPLDEVEYLKLQYGKAATETISTALSRSVGAIHNKAHKLGLTRATAVGPRTAWQREENDYIRANYGRIRPEQMSKSLKRSRYAVYDRARILGLSSRFGSPEYLKRQSLPRTSKPFSGFGDAAATGYVAGVIDGEGSIVKPPRFAISVTTTTKELASRLRELAGGSVAGPYLYGETKVFGEKTCHVQPQYRWNLHSGHDVYRFLKSLLPYLVVKAERAAEVIAYCEHENGWGEDESD